MRSTELIINSGCNEIGYGDGIRNEEDWGLGEENWDV